MKNVCILVVFVLAALISSCKKEEVTVGMSKSQQIEKIQNEIALNPGKFAPPSSEEVISLYREKSGGMKDGMLDPMVGYSVPSNNVILTDDAGNFKLVWIWSIISNGYLFDKGVAVSYYNRDYDQSTGFDFYIGWENEYCSLVNFTSNVKSWNQTNLSFSYPVTIGQFSFNMYLGGSENLGIYLAQLNFNCAWEIHGDNAAFGGTLNFNPENKKEIKLTAGQELFGNTRYYLKFPVQIGTHPSSKMNVWIWDAQGNSSEHIIVYVPYDGFPEVKLGETFKPVKVSYQESYYENGMRKFGEYTEKECFEIEPGIYGF